ncbi:MAG: YggS family pyridoxal phosphate-dependent enzyme [Gemmataceae bacterium]|nr:YggS family pyridoxal phosphate-dependent enzyme [Gemmataceae bacterium]
MLNLLRDRHAEVEARLSAACARAGRSRGDVTLVAVTKTVSVDVAALLPELGLLHLGENRPQELWRKAAALPASIHWHLIGHLQRNKIERTLPVARMIHSVDSERLLQALEQEAAKQQRHVDVLFEVNAGGEASKHGFAPAEVAGLTAAVRALRNVRVHGLMTMAPLQPPEECRPVFAALWRLRDELRRELGPPHDLPHLSMGMSNDFEVAVEEGATMVRLGSVLFEGLTP